MIQILGLILFPFIWLFVLRILASVSGWERLAILFPDQVQSSLWSIRFRTIVLGSVTYGTCCKIHICTTGIRIQPQLLFRYWHSPIFLPFTELSQNRSRLSIFGRVTYCNVGRNDSVVIQLPSCIFSEKQKWDEARIASHGTPSSGGKKKGRASSGSHL